MSDIPEYLTASELAEQLTKIGIPITDRSVRQWHIEGRIPSAVNEPKILRFRLEDVKTALATSAALAAKAREKKKRKQ